MYRIYIAEDDESIAAAIARGLSAWDFEVRTASDFKRIADEIAEYEPHLVLLDITLPFYNGFYWCSELRRNSRVPVVFISSAADNMNIVMAMNMGGDDFIAKPFDMSVLTAKIQALLRRTYDFAEQVGVIEHNGAKLNTSEAALYVGQNRVELTRNEYRILQTLMENKGKVVSREKLMDKLWETDCFIDENTRQRRKAAQKAGIRRASGIHHDQGRHGVHRRMRAYLYARRRVIAAFLLFAAVFGVVFWLGGVPMGAVGYASAICGVLALAFGCADFLSFRQRCAVLKKLQDEITVSVDNLPEPQNAAEEGCAELLRALFRSRAELQEHYEQSISDMTDYYTMWAHQIKTPIAAMRLSLAEQDSPESRSLAEELTRIEQYVEMVLCYIRLESSDTDYVIKECRLEDIVKSAVRRFSGQFIRKKLTLQMSGLDRMVLTDEKWLLFVIGQVLSNAVKYTRAGGITITCENDVLKIQDTGIGISPEDLPRIFEKGYTGCNGRSDMKASGLGLYLCRQICGRLGHRISAESSGGTSVFIDLRRSGVDLRE